MKLPITHYGNPILRKRGEPVAEITAEIRALAANMVETMEAADGVGLAAPQVGCPLRLFVMREVIVGVDGVVTSKPAEVILNPTFSKPSYEQETMQEGCLSLPGLYLDIDRPASIHVRYQTLEGDFREEHLTGFRARVFMHENDHINGVLFFDRLPAAERKLLHAVLQEIKQTYAQEY